MQWTITRNIGNRRRLCGAALLAMLLGLCLPGGTARAQVLNQLQGVLGNGPSGGGGLGQGMLPSVEQASPGNTAGVLQYCVRNNYMEGGAAASVKNALTGRLPGAGANDSGFRAGNEGLLQTGQGQSYGLGGGGIKAQLTHKVCDLVLQHARSLL